MMVTMAEVRTCVLWLKSTGKKEPSLITESIKLLSFANKWPTDLSNQNLVRTAITVVLVCGFGDQFAGFGYQFFFVMRPFFRNVAIFHNVAIFRSVLTHYKKMSILSGLMDNKILHFL